MAADRDDKLRADVLARLHAELDAELAADQADLAAWAATTTEARPASSPDEDMAMWRLGIAKQQALDGDLGPLREMYPEIANFIARPLSPRTHVRRDYVSNSIIKASTRRFKLDILDRTRAIFKKETGKARGDEEQIIRIAAEFLLSSRGHPEAAPPGPKEISKAEAELRRLKKHRKKQPEMINIRRPGPPITVTEVAQVHAAIARAAAASRARKKP
jgi:hypothetical protein